MKKATVLILAAAIGLSLAGSVEAQPAPAGNSGAPGQTAAQKALQALAAKIHAGESGASLTKAVRDFLMQYPSEAKALMQLEQSAAQAQQTAIIAGFAQAINDDNALAAKCPAAGSCPAKTGSQEILQALQSDPALAGLVASAQTTTGNQGSSVSTVPSSVVTTGDPPTTTTTSDPPCAVSCS